MVRLYSLFVWTVLELLMGHFLLTPVSGASVSWSRTIRQGHVSAVSSICTSMNEFRLGLVGFETTAVTVSAGTTYIKCSNATIAKQITDMYSSSSISESHFSCDGKSWSIGVCGEGASIAVKSVGNANHCTCSSQDLAIRPCIGNNNWGGIGPRVCSSVSTTLSITVQDDTHSPTAMPTQTPTAEPTWSPTATPTAQPTWSPTATPTAQPSWSPTATPTAQPTWSPTAIPTAHPTSLPSTKPTDTPTTQPTWSPTANPTEIPTVTPTDTPTTQPTWSPTSKPTIHSDLINDFDIVDKNGDDFLNYEEIAFAIADANKDGKLSLEEYEAARAGRIFVDTTYALTTSSTVKYSDDTYLISDFDTIDRNGDGFLNYDEVAFAIADIEKDGKLSLEEYEAALRNSIFVDTSYKHE